MEEARRPMGQDLAHALRTGPFSAALHLAIEDSGMRVEEIQRRLAQAGVGISRTMLNYWRRGRSRPERAESIRAVRALEEILTLPEGSLIAQLEGRRPRDLPPGRLEVDRLFTGGESIRKLVGELDRWMYYELSRVSMKDVYRIGPNKQELGLLCHSVMRANIDSVSRSVAVFQSDDPDANVSIHTIRCCRIGRVRTEPGAGTIAAEIVFDRIVSRGETVALEYEFRCESDAATFRFHRGFSVPIGQYVLELQFDADAVPGRVYRFEQRAASAPEQGLREVWVGSTKGAHLVAADVPPGVVGMRWEWE